MRSMPDSECAASVQSLDLNDDSLPVKLLLVLFGLLKLISFSFQSMWNMVNRRAGHYYQSSFYIWSFRMLAPITLKGKQILQSLCQAKLSWDDDLPTELKIHGNPGCPNQWRILAITAHGNLWVIFCQWLLIGLYHCAFVLSYWNLS